MKRIISIALILCMVASASRAQGSAGMPRSTVEYETNMRNSLWSGSLNASGLAFRPFALYHSLSIGFDGMHGDFRPQQKASASDGVSLDTEGAAMLGKFMVWGSFSFRNIFEKGVGYNAIQYEIEDDMPYYYADTQRAPWIKQEYDLSASMASPVLWDRVSFGLSVHYVTKVGARQLDPRSETYKYNVEVVPSVTVRMAGEHLLGLYGLFDNRSERAVPSMNNSMETPQVFLTKGLGEYIIGKVGGNDGVKPYMYHGIRYGGGLQYFYGGAAEVLADFGWIRKQTDVTTAPALPKSMGSTDNSVIRGKIQILFGNGRSDKFSVYGEYSRTDGIEHVQKLDNTAFKQEWVTVSSNVMSRYGTLNAGIEYDHLFGNSDSKGFDWTVGANVSFHDRSDVYMLPHSTLDATSAYAGIDGGRQFKFRSSSLLVTLDAGYRMSSGGGYVYGGKNAASGLLGLYRADAEFHTADYIRVGGRAAYTINGKKVNWELDLSADYIATLFMPTDRLLCRASFGIIF